MEKVFIYNELLGLKGSPGILQSVNAHGYYDTLVKVKEKRHRAFLPVTQTVLIFSEPVIEMDRTLEIE